jgi:hypothetical protein
LTASVQPVSRMHGPGHSCRTWLIPSPNKQSFLLLFFKLEMFCSCKPCRCWPEILAPTCHPHVISYTIV